ncbi:MAG: hypothetical protein AAFV29_03585, partial [Myxococcota bacterium]
GLEQDGGNNLDTGSPPPDIGTPDTGIDAGNAGDTGVEDMGVVDTGFGDVGVEDIGLDAGINDTGIEDTGLDAGIGDTGFGDTGLDAGGGDAGLPTIVFITPPPNLRAAVCSPPITVELQEAGTPRPVSADTTVELSFAPERSLRLYADSACGTPIVSATIPATQARTTFYATADADSTLTATTDGFGAAEQMIEYTKCDADCTLVCSECCGSICPPMTDCASNCINTSCDCHTDCQGTTGTCSHECRGSNCAIDCTGTNDCRVQCTNANANCVIRCDDANNCKELRCTGNASCMLICSAGNDNCSFEECNGGSGLMSCNDNITVCNRDCP